MHEEILLSGQKIIIIGDEDGKYKYIDFSHGFF